MNTELSVDLVVRRAEATVRAAFSVSPGERVAVLGPNGAGKSTLLAAISGQLALTSGTVRLDGELLEGDGVRVRPDRRGITLLGQKPQLFPHLDLAGNIAFGPRARGAGRESAHRIADAWLDRLGLADRATARPHQISGGQQQRVAIARAFAAQPRLMLLDEPFSALDAENVPSMRALLTEELTRAATTSLLVTHDLSDAWQWAPRCLVIEEGEIIADTSPAELAERPSHPFTAALAGFGTLRGVWDGGGLVVDDVAIPVRSNEAIVPGSRAFAVTSPRHVEVVAAQTPGALRGIVEQLSWHAGVGRIRHSSGLIADVDPGSGQMPRVGDPIWIRPHDLRAYAEPGHAHAARDIRE